MKLVELLAPAKDYAAAAAAVDYGADAIYIGGARFGARQAAGNSAEEIARVVEYAHRFGVRVHATLNTLVWDDELEAAERQARSLIDAGVDALIVQDMALRRMDLPVELHASTQVSNRTPEGARFLGEAGFARVILERNLTLEEIRAICAATAAEVECFVHGAVCVGYSGRCFLSRSMSARSGNRGACSQPCRLTWDLTDGKGRTWIAGKHLLSVRDMNLSQRIGDLLDAGGVTSFKIEGRLKDTRLYPERCGPLPPGGGRGAGPAAWGWCGRPSARASRISRPNPSKSFTRGESDYSSGRKARRSGVVRHPEGGRRTGGPRGGRFGRHVHARRCARSCAGRRHLFPDAARRDRDQRQRRGGPPHHAQSHGGDHARGGGPPQFRPPFHAGRGAQPHAAGDSGEGRGGGDGRRAETHLYGLRGRRWPRPCGPCGSTRRRIPTPMPPHCVRRR